MKLHVLFVAKQYFGNPDFVRLSVGLAHKKHHISVVTSFREGDKQIRSKEVDICEAPPLIRLHSLGYPLAFPISQMYKIVHGKGVQVIHALSDFSTHTASAAAVSAMTDVPFVYTIQGIGWKTNFLVSDVLMKLYELEIQRLVARKADRVILLSERLMPRARKLDVEEKKIAVVPPGVDCNYLDPERPEIGDKADSLRNRLGLAEKSTIVGYVGRLVPGKAVHHLISAMTQIRKSRSKVLLLVVGDGPEQEILEKMARDAGIEAAFVGWQHDVLPYYSVMDVFVLPSLFEGVPNVLLEAMAMKKPVVATDVGANADLVENDVNGFLVPAGDLQRMATVLEKLVEDEDLRSRFGKISRERIIKRFSLERNVEKIEEVYNEIA